MQFILTVLQIILFLLMLGILITFHELGHFFAARIFKVYIFEFAIGMGPKVYQKKTKETKYTLRALPIGGYVSMLGEEDSIPDDLEGNEIDFSRSLTKINRGKRAVVMSAGIIVNLFLAFAMFLISNTMPQTRLSSGITITADSIASNEADLVDGMATKLGLQTFEDGSFQTLATNAKVTNKGVEREENYYVVFNPTSFNDLRLTTNSILIDSKITKYFDLQTFTYELKEGDQVSFVLNFDSYANEDVTTVVKNIVLDVEAVNPDAKEKTYVLKDYGVNFTKEKFHHSFIEVFSKSGSDFVDSTTLIGRSLKHIFTSKNGLQNVSGPIGIFNMASSTLSNFGVSRYIYLWGVISMQLAIFNLLPFPGLDGWHLLVITFEAIFRREINPKFKNIVSVVGIVLLFALMIAIALKDIIGLL